MNSAKLENVLKKKCLKYPVITFDIFDTLLKRDVMTPTEVFRLVEQEFDKKYNSASSFASKRIQAEYTLRKENNLSEVTLDEIYERIDFSGDQRHELKKLEFTMEEALLHENYPLKQVFDFCVEQKKKIFLISDMYLPLPFLTQVLKNAGYTGYERIYLSCEYRETKHTGELFSRFLKEERIKKESVLHIGDNFYADVLGAKRAGIKSYHIPTYMNNTIYTQIPQERDSISVRTLYAFINSHECACTTRPEQLGYEMLGPLIYGFCTYLHNLPERKERKLWLVARDMYLFTKAYQLLYPEDNSEYVFLSRKSLRPVYTEAVGDLTKSGEAFPEKDYTLPQIIRYMGYEPEDVELPLNNAAKIKKYNGQSLGSYPEICQVLSSPQILKKEKELAVAGRRYLEEHGFFSEPILFADVGWHGTTQLLLNKILEEKTLMTPILGCYLGCCKGTKKRIGDTYKTWLFDEDDDRPFMRGIVLLESMILAPHGTTIGYKKGESDKVEPQFADVNDIPGAVQEMQKGAMAFVDEFRQSILSKMIAVDPEFVCAGFEKLEMKPLKEELEYIGDLDYENFYMTKIASPKSLGFYLTHYKELVKDFMYAGWRTGFMYRLFRVRLPYGKLYDLGRLTWRKIKGRGYV